MADTLRARLQEAAQWHNIQNLNGEYTGTSVSYEWHVRFQARLELPDDTWVFPAPSPKAPQRDTASQAFPAQPAIHYPVTAALEL